MKSACLSLLLAFALQSFGQKTLPPLKDGTVIDEKTGFRHDGPLFVSGRVMLKGISLDLRGPISVAAGADLDLEDVTIRVSDPPASTNGASGLQCKGPAKVRIHHSTMTPIGGAHPIWRLRGEIAVDDFQTTNSEFHLDHVEGSFQNFTIFELEISNASHIVAHSLHLVFLSTHTGDDDKLTFSDIPANQPFSRKLSMGSRASADLTDTTAQFFLLYVHGKSEVSLSRIGRAQLAIAPECRGTLRLPHGLVGSVKEPVTVPETGASDCPFRLRLSEVNADTWDVYAGGHADLTFEDSVIDELTANSHAKLKVRDSDIYADWISLDGESQLDVSRSTVGAQRLATQRPDLITSQARIGGYSHATFDHVTFDCDVLVTGNSTTVIRDSVTAPKHIRRSDDAIVQTDPKLPVEDLKAGSDL